MGAAALQKRLDTFDLDAESELLREIIATARARRRPERSSAFGSSPAFQVTRNHPTGMVLDCVPVIRRTCGPWSSSTVAGLPPPT
jgi:DNA-directed RNA polymerase subunit beta'